MRLIASSQPSGVVRIQEMRDMFPLVSGAWHAPHLLMTRWSLTGNPSSSEGGGAGFAGIDDGAVVASCAKPEATLSTEKSKREMAAPERHRKLTVPNRSISRPFSSLR